MISQVMSKVSFVSKIADIMTATSDDDKPIPGYLYKEVCQITFSSAENCENCVEFLAERLDHESLHVKLKVLKLMRYMTENGHTNFRLGLMKKSSGIREATKQSGPPDPLHGDVPYKMIRKTAQGLLEYLFNVDDNQESRPQRTSVNTMGLGASSTGASYGNRMEGFGNSPATQTNKSLGDTVKASVAWMAANLADDSDDQQRALLARLEGTVGYTPPRMTDMAPPPVGSIGREETDQQTQESPTKAPVPTYIPGRAGGGWEDSDDDHDDDDDVSGEKDNTSGKQKSVTSGADGQDSSRVDMESMVDDSAERAMVMKYLSGTEGQTNMAFLPRAQLKLFVKECGALNCDKVVEFLGQSLLTAQGDSLLRNLMLLETLMLTDLIHLESLTTVCKDGLVTAVDTTGPTRSKARKLIQILERLTHQKDILPDNKPVQLISAT